MKKGLLNMLVCVLAAALCSCNHKELCYHHPHTASVKVEFDWRDAREASPEGMCVFFYPMEGEEAPMRRFDFKGKTGGQIDIQVGKYRVLCYNNDTEIVLMRGTEGFDTHEAYTRNGDLFETIYGASARSSAPRANGTEDERVVLSPEMMWGCTALDVEITETGTSYICIPESEKDEWIGKPATHTAQVITLYPHELICTYTYEIRNVKGLGRVSQMCGSITGMAPSLLFHDESVGKECVTIPYEANVGDATTIVGKFLTFGHNETNTEPHRMLLYVWMDNGEKYCYGIDSDRFDVTGQVHSAPDKRHVHIIIDGLDLPKPIGEGDLDTTIDDWHEINEDIHM